MPDLFPVSSGSTIPPKVTSARRSEATSADPEVTSALTERPAPPSRLLKPQLPNPEDASSLLEAISAAATIHFRPHPAATSALFGSTIPPHPETLPLSLPPLTRLPPVPNPLPLVPNPLPPVPNPLPPVSNPLPPVPNPLPPVSNPLPPCPDPTSALTPPLHSALVAAALPYPRPPLALIGYGGAERR